MNKFEFIRSILLRHNLPGPMTVRPTLLDVGCRGCELKAHVGDIVDYVGVDLVQNQAGTVDYVLDVSRGLPFDDASFDVVAALDLVEHLDDFEGGLNELLRVARQQLIIVLPNLAHLLFRARFLLHGTLSGKYDMRYGMGQDRHRWVTTQDQCDKFMTDFACDKNLALKTIWFNDSRKKELLASLCQFVGLRPNLWVWSTVYVLVKSG